MDLIEDCVQEAVGDSCQARPAIVYVVGLEKWTAYKRGRIRKALRKLVWAKEKNPECCKA